MELVLLIGLQGSGKSSFYRERFAATHALVSKDLFPNARNREKRQRRELEAAWTAGHPTVLDNTNATRADRAPVIAAARKLGLRVVGYYFESKVDDCLRRNRAREAPVPEVAIFSTIKRLERPGRDEGFDVLHHVKLAEGGGFAVTDWIEEP
jgi:predicted kinase